MRRGLASIVVAAMCLVTLAGCDGSAGAQPHLGATIRVGVNLELSGGREHIGTAALQGAQLAFDQANSKGGIKGKQIELVQVDNATSIGRAVSLTTKLMTQGKVLAVLGPVTADMFRPTLTVADKQEVVAMSSLACNKGVLNKTAEAVFTYAFRSCVGYDFQGAAMARFASENLSARTAMVIRAAEGPTADFADAFTQTFTGAGGAVSAQETFNTGETDFARYVEALQGSPTDVVYIAGPPSEAAHIIRTLRDAGVQAPILGMESHDSPTMSEIAGASALNKVYFTTNYTPLDTENQKAQQFLADFQAAHGGAWPNQTNALAYDAALLIIDAITRAEQVNGVEVGRALASTRNLETATGRLSIGENHEVIKDALVVELVDGQPASVTHIAQ